MAVNVVRYRAADGARWGILDGDDVLPIAGSYETTEHFMTEVASAVRAGHADTAAPTALAEIELLSPITRNQQFICQATNYRSHMIESGIDPASSPFNIFFRKASSCLAPADTDITCPSHVDFLDYELEIGLVLSSNVVGPVEVSAETLADHVGGLVMVNDVSARDVQLPETQFYKGKSYRTFGPTGPYLALVDAAELSRFAELHLRLTVNGEVRQDSGADDMVHLPPATLTELSQIQDWAPGDLVATGTPGGCALQAPAKPLAMAAQVVSPKRRAALMKRAAARNERRLRTGDRVEATIATADGRIDLGRQACTVTDAAT